ncbi:MAG: pitrilysin family protein [Candidatus Eisenbacteria bacterium]
MERSNGPKNRIFTRILPILALLTVTAFTVATPSIIGSQTLEDKVKEFTLANGMRFVVVERPVAPVFFAAIGFNVGSINEWDGVTGISHILEHMLFKGTKKIGTLSYAKEKKYLEKEDDLAIALADTRRQIGNWRLEIYDDFVRGIVSSFPEDLKHEIGSDKLKELEALVSALEARKQMPEEAGRYPTLIEDSGVDYYDRYLASKRLQMELAQVQREHSSLIVKEEFWDIYLREGGRMLNAFTANDLTAYIVYLPSNRLELWMSVESDRFANPIFRELYQERDVVAEERRLGENDPDEQLFDTFLAAAFQASPYRRSVIGWMSDIQDVTRPELESYFGHFYAPNNAVAILVGDVDVNTVRRMATRYFGRIPRQAPIAPLITQEPKQKGERRVTVEHTANPRVLIGYHIPATPHPDSYPLKALMEVLGSGRTSRLYKKIYQELQLTSEAPEVSNGPGEKLDNLLMIDAAPRYPHTAEEVEKAIYAEIEVIQNEPPSEREMQRIRNKIDAAMVRTLGNNLGIAFNIGFNAISRGDWRTYLEDLEKIKQVKPEDVSYVAKQYLTPENRTVATLVKIEEKKEAGGEPEEIDMKALMSYVRSLPEAEQRELFQKFQAMGPEEREQLAKELTKRMKAAQPKSGQGEKEAQGGK